MTKTLLLLCASLLALSMAYVSAQAAAPSAACKQLTENARDGDVVFIDIDRLPFREVAETTLSWTSHVGIAFHEPEGLMVYESTFPFSKKTPACKYIARSKNERFALTRHRRGLSESQVQVLKKKAASMFGILYNTGFDYDNGKQFCSKFVFDSYAAIGIQVGKIITFQNMLDAFPAGPAKDALVGFWNRWFYAGLRFSGTPWERRTVTPASQLLDPGFDLVVGRREI